MLAAALLVTALPSPAPAHVHLRILKDACENTHSDLFKMDDAEDVTVACTDVMKSCLAVRRPEAGL